MKLYEITMNIQDIVNLPVLNNVRQQSPVRAPLHAQIYGLIPALEKFGLMEIAGFIKERVPQTDPGIALQALILKAIPQQPVSEADFERQAMAAHVIANKLGLYDAADYIKQM